LEKLGLQADGVAGHSSGEYAAFAAAGVAGDRDEARLQAFSDTLIGVQIESEVLDNIESTALIALGTDRDQVDALLASAGVDARVAMDNCPHQVVVAVAPADEEKLLAVCRQQAIIAERLAFDRPYHTPAFMPYSQRLLNSLSKLEL